ncbi:hypothetical protein [Borreliella valaisiana]|uniref:hypothetical protein n=1 Tax=Borreliella valaisiana TaxID=62088 RepID=UPI003B210099
MNKKMFIICTVFILIISCKNYAISKDLENLKENAKEKVEGFLEIKKEELTEGLKSLGSEVYPKVELEVMQADGQQGQVQEQVAQLGVSTGLEDLDKKIKDLKDKIEETDDKITLGTYSGYGEELKKLKEELEDKLKDKKEEDKKDIEGKLKELEDSLKEKIEKRKKALEDAQKKFEKFKQEVESATGVTHGHQAQNQRGGGAQAWTEAKQLGINVSFSSDDGTDTGDFAKKVIDDALEKIKEELEKIEEKKE